MTPKEKAQELVLKYLRVDNNTREWFNTYIAKQCALIAVDEIILDSKGLLKYFNEDDSDLEESIMAYWNEVKQEIEKL